MTVAAVVVTVAAGVFYVVYTLVVLLYCLRIKHFPYFSNFQQNREGVASKVHRQGTIDGLKKFNARRKLKVCL